MSVCEMICILGLVLILLYKCDLRAKGEFNEDTFPLEITKGLQGFFAVCIVLHHVTIALQYEWSYHNEFHFFEDKGVLFVGFFFFCSGYGLITSLNTKPNYLNGFMRKRILTVLVPFFICNYAYIIVSLVKGQKYAMKDLVAAFFGIQLFNTQTWFAVEILLLYLCFFFLYKYTKKTWIRFGGICIAVLSIVLYGLLLDTPGADYVVTNWFRGEWWYNTTLLFLVGMIFARFKEPIKRFIKKHYYSSIIILGIGFYLFYRMSVYALDQYGYWTQSWKTAFVVNINKIITFGCQVPMVLFFVLLIYVVMSRVQPGNKGLKFLGKISLEMILMNNVFLVFFKDIQRTYGTYVYTIFVLVGTIVSAIVLNWIKEMVLERKS